ncbi:hypothetical protein NKH86_21975, partial [Mesorhizobium sp. M0913]|uniref:hypothetical protein n=1 Tax=Mesorhizobium sp. M0913 TaxID=2957026 RepID=UPI003338F68F
GAKPNGRDRLSLPKKSGLGSRAPVRAKARGRPPGSQAGQNFARISVKRRSYVEKLDDIETPLSGRL